MAQKHGFYLKAQNFFEQAAPWKASHTIDLTLDENIQNTKCLVFRRIPNIHNLKKRQKVMFAP
jgi:hypothetical protein